MRRAVGNYELDDDPARIDPAAAAAFLTTEAYWGRWRTAHDITRQIGTAWRVIGAYDAAGAMVGLARAISDGGSAYLADVYVLPAHRGRGLGKAVVAMMVEEGPGAGFRWMLHTSDAYGLYRQFGFEPPPDNYMERPAGAVTVAGGGRHAVAGTGPLEGDLVRLEPLGVPHVPGLLKAAAQDPSLYQWVLVPQDEAAMRRHVEDALAARAKGIAVPFAVVRLADETVIGATRFHQLDYWARTALVEPSVRAAHGSGSQRLYSFRDICVLKVVKRLLDTGISLQQIRTAVTHLRDRGTDDLARLTLMSDGVTVYECTSTDEVVDLLAGGQGVFGIALGRIWKEVDGTLAELPAERAEKGTSIDGSPGAGTSDELSLRRAMRTSG